MPENDVEWSVKFARSGIRRALAQMIDDATPGLIDRLASDPNAYTQLIAITKLAADEVEEMLRETATTARHTGLDWEQIGEAAGISRQEAQQRFGSAPNPEAPKLAARAAAANIGAQAGNPPVGTTVTVSMADAPLQQLGDFGWHGIAFSSTTWTLQFDDQQWEHKTTLRKNKPPAGDGWQRIGTYLSTYWKRPTGRPILPGAPSPHSFGNNPAAGVSPISLW